MTRQSATAEIQNLLVALEDIFYVPVTFSYILPLASAKFIEAINKINDDILKAGFFCMFYPSFKRDARNRVDSSLYCADGVHVNSNGIGALLGDLAAHLQASIKYYDDVE